jgi:hypothetical protein
MLRLASLQVYDDASLAFGQETLDQQGAEETGSAGNENRRIGRLASREMWENIWRRDL